MVTRNHIQIFRSLVPMSWAYGLGTGLRNAFYDKEWLQSKRYPLPVICVGNLAVGGTGKTPHTEYIVRLLQEQGLQVATLSRGYGRKTKGFLIANRQHTAQEIGDEPWQLKHNLQKVTVAVDEDRCHGIERLMQEEHPRIEAVILDDAYQHRSVKAGLYILLTDYHRLYTEDMLLPAGRLRESKRGAERAHLVVVTKCPSDMSESDFEDIKSRLNLLPHQQLFFSTIAYYTPTPVFKQAKALPSETDESLHLLAVTGIAHPEPMTEYLRQLTPHVELMSFPDHHDFSKHDLDNIARCFERIEGDRRIITTQKDAARLQGMESLLPEIIKTHLYALPIRIRFLNNQQEAFDRNIIDFVRLDARR